MNRASTSPLPLPSPSRLLLAGHSVRAAAEAARRDGFDVIAVDRFGDADARAVACAWYPLDPLPVGAADVPWLLASGFESAAALAALADRPLLGTSLAAIARVRDPRQFFAALDARGIAHPAVRLTRPPTAQGWLSKDFAGCGGLQVRPADPEPVETPDDGGGRYWQQHVPEARPVSITFLGNGRQAAVLGLNHQRVHPEAAHPWRFGGLIGPLPVGGRLGTRLQGLADRLTSEFELRGLASLDLLQCGDELLVLEINARLPASLVLYGPEGGLMRAHVEACRHERLPDGPALQRLRGTDVRGYEIVRAVRPTALDATGVAVLQRQAAALGLHDLPASPQTFDKGDPLCSIEVRGDSADAVGRALTERMARVQVFLETIR